MKTTALLILGLAGLANFAAFQNMSPTGGTIAQASPEIDDGAQEAAAASQVPAPAESGSGLAVCPIQGKTELKAADLLDRGAKVKLKAGSYYVKGGIVIRKPLELSGASRNNTRITFCIGNDEPGIQILAKDGNVKIHDLELQVHVNQRLRDSDGTGGTGNVIQIGTFLHSDATIFFPVQNVELYNLIYSRAAGSYTAVAMALFGNVNHVYIHDIILRNKHSIALLMHWSGILDPKSGPTCAHTKAPQMFTSSEESAVSGYKIGTQKCTVTRSFHVHDIKVENYRMAPNAYAGFMIMLSSTYNVSISGVEGTSYRPISIVPGDESNTYAGPDQKDKIGSNIQISDVKAWLSLQKGVTSSAGGILVASKGTSKYPPYLVTGYEYRNLVFRNLEFLPAPNDMVGKAPGTTENEVRTAFFRGLYLPYGRAKGVGMFLENADFGDMGLESPYSAGVYARNAKGVHLDNVKMKMRNGLVINNSRDISVANSVFDRSQASATVGTKTSDMARGIVFTDNVAAAATDKTKPFPGYPSELTVTNTQFLHYDYGKQLASNLAPNTHLSDLCERLIEKNAKYVSNDSEYLGKNCDSIRQGRDFYVFAGQSNMMGAGTVAQVPELADARVIPNAAIWVNRANDANFFAPASLGTFVNFNLGTNTVQYPTPATPENEGIGRRLDRFGPEAGFAKIYSDRYPSRDMYAMKFAKGRTSLLLESDWAPSAQKNLLDEMVLEAVAASRALPKGTPLKCIVWVQGEADRRLWVKASAADRPLLMEQYKKNLAKMIQALRERTSSPNARLALVRLSYADKMGDGIEPEYDAPLKTLNTDLHKGTVYFRRMQTEFAQEDSNTKIVSSDGLEKKDDNIHFTSPSLVTLGERIFSACNAD